MSAMPAANARIAILQLVAKAGLVLGDHVADRVFRADAEDLLAARPRADAALRRLVLMGYLDVRPVAIELTEAASRSTLSTSRPATPTR